MLAYLELLEAVRGALEERFPGEQYYMDRVPTDFARPSFLLEGGPVELEDAGCGCLWVKAVVKVTAFVAVDEYHNSHVSELVRRMAAVQELFAAEGLRVGDRVLHIVKNTGTYQFDYAEIQLTFQYQDDRPGAGEWPLMGEVNVRTRGPG